VIDLHSHILPGVDDGPGDIAGSVAMARTAVADGVRAMVATPHVSDVFPETLAQIGPAAEELRGALAAEGVGLDVLEGGEVAMTRVSALDDDELRRLCLGPQERWLLLESPYTYVSDLLERTVFELQTRGFRVLLAHPERSPCFGRGPERLTELVERGVACSITAGSLVGTFGGRVKKQALEMVEHGLVHDIASDSHDASGGRSPVLSDGLEALAHELAVEDGYGAFLTEDAPGAIIAGEALPHADPPRPRRRGPLGFLRRR
jgi:protein-tyrosine phosphatase